MEDKFRKLLSEYNITYSDPSRLAQIIEDKYKDDYKELYIKTFTENEVDDYVYEFASEILPTIHQELSFIQYAELNNVLTLLAGYKRTNFKSVCESLYSDLSEEMPFIERRAYSKGANEETLPYAFVHELLLISKDSDLLSQEDYNPRKIELLTILNDITYVPEDLEEFTLKTTRDNYDEHYLSFRNAHKLNEDELSQKYYFVKWLLSTKRLELEPNTNITKNYDNDIVKMIRNYGMPYFNYTDFCHYTYMSLSQSFRFILYNALRKGASKNDLHLAFTLELFTYFEDREFISSFYEEYKESGFNYDNNVSFVRRRLIKKYDAMKGKMYSILQGKGIYAEDLEFLSDFIALKLKDKYPELYSEALRPPLYTDVNTIKFASSVIAQSSKSVILAIIRSFTKEISLEDILASRGLQTYDEDDLLESYKLYFNKYYPDEYKSSIRIGVKKEDIGFRFLLKTINKIPDYQLSVALDSHIKRCANNGVAFLTELQPYMDEFRPSLDYDLESVPDTEYMDIKEKVAYLIRCMNTKPSIYDPGRYHSLLLYYAIELDIDEEFLDYYLKADLASNSKKVEEYSNYLRDIGTSNEEIYPSIVTSFLESYKKDGKLNLGGSQ